MSVLAGLVFVLLPGGANADPSTSSGAEAEEVKLVAPAQFNKLAACRNWSINEDWGSTKGKACRKPTRIEGWIEDKKDDHYCVVVIVRALKGGHEVEHYESPKVCGKGQRKEFNADSRKDADQMRIELSKKEE